MTAALTEIRFYGHLRSRFGRSLRLAVESPAEAIRALCAVLPGFQRYLTEHSQPGYRVVVGKTPLADKDQVVHPSGRQAIGLVPAVAGKAGLGKVFAGAALIGLAVWLGPGALPFLGTSVSSIAMNMGISMVLGGVSQMIAGNPSSPAPAEAANNQPSYAFNGAVNTSAQGNPVPICYGRVRCGSQVIGSGIEAASL